MRKRSWMMFAGLMTLCMFVAACEGIGEPTTKGPKKPGEAGAGSAGGGESTEGAAAPIPGEKKPKEVTTKTGLKYTDLKEGTGAAAKKGDKVVVHYTGWLTSGKKFDSSVGGDPFEFDLGAGMVIKGWDEGVAGMKVGGKRKLVIPPDLAYGKRGAGGGLIPPDATLVFEVELLKIK